MRTIKFRGKAKTYYQDYNIVIKNNGWAYGDLIQDVGDIKYIDGDFLQCEVIPKTVGQFTGLYDKNGNEIYEGDIVEIVLSDNQKYKGEIYYDSPKFRLRGDSPLTYFHFGNQERMEVVGNIHEGVRKWLVK